MGTEFTARHDVVSDKVKAKGQPCALRVGRADDPAEARADRFADDVEAAMRSPRLATVTNQPGRIRRSTTPAMTAVPATASRLRRAATADPLGGSVIDQSTANAITSVSGGDPVPEPVRRSAETASGHDLGGVRIHEGEAPAELSASLQATAFTIGSNIFLGGDAARPGTSAGNHLLAHELGHVVDDGGGSTVGRVRRLVSGSALREELGGPSGRSNTYRALIKDLDSYATVTSNPLTTTDNAGLLKEAQAIDKMVVRIIESCSLFIDDHGKDKRAGRVAEIKADASRERTALRERTNELKRGARPDWANWRQAIAENFAARDIDAERGVQGGSDKGAMNEVTAFDFGARIGARGRDNRARGGFFKADKPMVTANGETEHAKNLGIPLGGDHPEAKEHDEAGPRFANRSVASYRIDQLLNANVIAKTELAVLTMEDGTKVHGQLMAKAKGKKQVGHTKGEGDLSTPGSTADDPVVQRLLSKLDLVDSLCGQVDRHGGNVFIDRDQTGGVTSITGIDNDIAFGTKNFVPGKTDSMSEEYAGIGKYIDAETGEAVLKLTDRDLRIALDDLLLPDEIEAAIVRLTKTQDVIREAKQAGRLIGPERWGADTTAKGGQKHAAMKPVGYHASMFHFED